MSEVKRYKNLVALGIDAVKASDYDALQSRLDASNAAHEAAAQHQGELNTAIYRLEQQLAERDAVLQSLINLGISNTGGWAEFDEILAMAKALLFKPAVIIPDSIKTGEHGMGEYGAAMVRGFEACRRETARLNGVELPAKGGDGEVSRG